MNTLTYQQTWPQADLEQPTQAQILSVFETDEVVWLMQQGFEPQHSQRAIPSRAHWVCTLTFQVPDEVVTYLGLRWPEPRREILAPEPTTQENPPV